MRFPDRESSTVELKVDIPQNKQVIKTTIAFCNSHGGKIVIGVADDGRIVGLSEGVIEEIIEKLEQTIFDSCEPRIIPKLYIQRFDEKSVLFIEILEGMNKPYYLRAEGPDKGVYVRVGRHTVNATPEIIKELQWQSRGIDFEKTAIFDARVDDLDNRAIENFIKNRKNYGALALDEQVLKSYGLIAYDQSRVYPSIAGMLLFGKKPQLFLTEAMIICSHFKGKAGRETIATIDCEGTLFNQFAQAFEFVTSRLSRSFTITGLKREETLEIPEVAIREALLNIIVHRNYHLKSPAKIAIYEDRVEFFSPGGFPGPFRQENKLSGITYLRNPAICKVLREANYIEKLGTGFITIFTSCEKSGLESPQIIDGGDFVKCILSRIKKQNNKMLTEEEQILELFYTYKEITVKEVENKLSVSSSTALRRIREMISNGVLESVGRKRNIRYRLKN